MKKIFNRFLIALYLVFIAIASINAQVTIGKDILPAEYSLLQIEYDKTLFPNGAGIQLPRLSGTDKISLDAKIASDPEAVGLTIFNTDTKVIEYWNGTIWVSVPGLEPQFSSGNGLTSKSGGYKNYSTIVGLGGELTEPTTINLQGKTLNITQVTGSTDNPVFQVKNLNGNLTVTDKKVGIGISEPTAKLHIQKPESSDGLRLVDGNQGLNKVMTALDNTGKASWSAIQEYVTTRKKYIKSTPTGGIKFNIDTQVSDSIICEPGKWLIVGKVNVANGDNDSGNLYTWAKIKNVETQTVLVVSGVKTEVGGFRFSLPQVVFYAEFTEVTPIALFVNPPYTGTIASRRATLNKYDSDVLPFDSYGFLFAIKLSD